LNRTLHESPATASLHSATPKRKIVPCFFDFREGGFFLKWKGYFSFWALPSKYSGSVAGLQFGLGFGKTIFWGFGFAKASPDFPRPQKGVWGMNAGGLVLSQKLCYGRTREKSMVGFLKLFIHNLKLEVHDEIRTTKLREYLSRRCKEVHV
jgi:hypothetical protein